MTPKPRKKVIREGWAKFTVTKQADGKLKLVAYLQDNPELAKIAPKNKAEKP